MIKFQSFFIWLTFLFHFSEVKGNYECPYAQLHQTSADGIFPPPHVAAPQPIIGATDYSLNAQVAHLISSYENSAVSKLESSIINTYMSSDKPEKILCATPPLNCANNSNLYYRNLDGSCNNLQYPGYGIVNSRYGRILAPRYSNNANYPTVSVYGPPLPNARLISLMLYGDETLPDSFHTWAFLQFGQLAAHDISFFAKSSSEDCCVNANSKNCYPIELHPGGPIYSGTGKKCLNFVRALSDAKCPNKGLPYEEKINVVTSYLDLSPVYGNSVEQNKKLRTFTGGYLKTNMIQNRHWLPISNNEDGSCGDDHDVCYNIPDIRNQFTPVIVAFHTIFVREHNRLAYELAKLNYHYSDEELFQEARKINIAQYQYLTYYEWLPLFIGHTSALEHNLIYEVGIDEFVDDYNPTVDPAPYSEYAAAAFRYSHNQIPGWFTMISPDYRYNKTMRLSDYFSRSSNIELISEADNFDAILRGTCTQRQKLPDANIDKEIKHYFDRKDSDEYGTDLKAVDIQRGRDYALGSYNDYRQYCGLPRAYNWAGFANEISQEKIHIMKKLYASPDDVDLGVGGSLEVHLPESLVGPTFHCIVVKQLAKTRKSDRFFFENNNPHGGFTREQLAEIRKVSFSSLICNNADYLQILQPNAFVIPNPKNPLVSCSNIPKLDLTKWKRNQHANYY